MSGEDVELWKRQLAEGKLSQEEFDALVKSRQSLGEMDNLLKEEES